MITITGAAQTGSTKITVDGLTVGTDATITIRRAWAGQQATVRGAVDLPVTGSMMVVVDYEAPFVSCSYSVTALKSDGSVSAQESSGAVVLSSDKPRISDPLNPSAAADVTLDGDALAQLDYVMPLSVGQPLGSSEPVAIVGTRQAAGNVSLDITCRTLAERDAVLSVLRSAGTVCLRVPDKDAYSMLPPMCYLAAGTVSQVPINLQYGGTSTRVKWTGQVVRAPAVPIAAPTRTYADVVSEASSYADLTEMYDTYNDLLLG